MGPSLTVRKALVERITKETSVQVALSLDGGPLDLLPDDTIELPASVPDQKVKHHASQDTAHQQVWVWTGIGFLDHMIHALAKHGGWSLRVRTVGDLASESERRAFRLSRVPGAVDSELTRRTKPQLMIITQLKIPFLLLEKPSRGHLVTERGLPDLATLMHPSTKL